MPKLKKQQTAYRMAASSELPQINSRWFTAGMLGLIALVTLVAYSPALNGKYIWDDDAHVTRPELRSLDGLRRIWFEPYRVAADGQVLPGATQQYYPLLHSAFWMEYQLWGDWPPGYHLVNLLQHLAATCLVYLILRKLQISGALLAAGIFALHPVQVESVAWITEQKNTLSAVFYLSAMLAYLYFDATRKPGFYVAAIFLFVLGLLSKTVTATLPAALLVIFWWQRGRLSWRRDVLPLAPLFVLGAAAGMFTAWAERVLIGAEGAAYELSIVQRGLLAGRVIWFYVGNLLWPGNLIFIYPRWEIDPAVWWQWLFPLMAIVALTALFVLRRRWRGPLAGTLFFVGTLFPVLGFFNVYPFVYSFVADHFQYLASLGMIVLAAAGLTIFNLRSAPHVRSRGHLLCAALLGVLAARSWNQAQMYSDVVTLYQETLKKNPECWMGYTNLGLEYANSGKTGEAKEQYLKALAIKPNDALTHNNLGNAFAKEGLLSDAIEQYQIALNILPDYPQGHYNLGTALKLAGRIQEAAAHFQRALQLRPDYAEAYNNLGNLLREAGDANGAIENYRQALKWRPRMAEIHNNLATTLLEMDQLPEAIAHYEIALQLKPNYPEINNNLGSALTKVGRLDEGIEHYRQALKFKPDYPEAHNNLGEALLQKNQPQEAISHFQAALRLMPDLFEVRVNLAKAYAHLQQPAEAIAAAQQALESARKQGRTAEAAEIEAWLADYRAKTGSSK